MIIKKENCILDVDIDKTANYYEEVSLCECPDCRNFYTQAKDTFPLLTQFLSELGIDISRPDELGAHEIDNEICYQFVAYTAAGKILQSDKYEIDLIDNEIFLNIVLDNSYIPNEQQTENYFTVTVYGIQLPWVLDEPYHEEASRKTLIDKIKGLFKRKTTEKIPSMPSWDKIVEMMYDKDLDAFADEVAKVIYSKDKTMRYVVLKDDKGFFRYHLEVIYQFDEDEWKYIFSNDNALPAMWEPFQGNVWNSVFVNEEELLKEMKAEPEYKQYF